MNFRNVLSVIILTICITVAAIVTFINWSQSEKNEIRCSSFIKMDLAMDASSTLLIDSVINFQRINGNAFLLIKGSSWNGNIRTNLSRQIILRTESQDHQDGFEYLIKKTLVGPTDNTPDDIFYDLLSEISVDNKHVFLNDQVQRDDAVLIGGPYSVFFMCVKY